MSTTGQFARYLLAGGLAAAANYGSRFGFSAWLPFEAAVIAAYLIGMATAFVLMRRWAFGAGSRGLGSEVGGFVLVNLLAVAQTLAVSSLMLRVVLPWLGVEQGTAAIAHAIGVAVPVISSYFGHKRISFR